MLVIEGEGPGVLAALKEAFEPTRAECRYCGRRQKLRKDGTVGRHRVLDRLTMKRGVCPGSGERGDVAPA